MKFDLSFRFFDSWYIIKYLLTETSGKQYVLWTSTVDVSPGFVSGNMDSLGKHGQSRETWTVSGPQNILFPSVSVNKC